VLNGIVRALTDHFLGTHVSLRVADAEPEPAPPRMPPRTTMSNTHQPTASAAGDSPVALFGGALARALGSKRARARSSCRRARMRGRSTRAVPHTRVHA
jgi:hypothetical protein